MRVVKAAVLALLSSPFAAPESSAADEVWADEEAVEVNVTMTPETTSVTSDGGAEVVGAVVEGAEEELELELELETELEEAELEAELAELLALGKERERERDRLFSSPDADEADAEAGETELALEGAEDIDALLAELLGAELVGETVAETVEGSLPMPMS